MVLKHAIMLTKAGIPLFSFDFRRGKLHVDSVLFSGLISALHTFVDDVIVPDKEAKIGFITSSDMDVMYCKGNQIISVLLGSELNKEFEERLMWITTSVDAGIEFDLLDIKSDSKEAEDVANIFKYHLLNAFNSQSIQSHHTPVIVQDLEKINIYIESSPHHDKFKEFVELINGKLTLYEIHEFSANSWVELKMMTSELVSAHLIVLKTDINDEQIFKLTVKGMDMMFELEQIPPDLIQIWDDAISPFLAKIDSYTPYGAIKQDLETELTPRDMYQLESAVQQLLTKEIIQPLSSLVQLGIFLQQFYLNFYQYLIARVGNRGEKAFFEKINRNRYIKLIVPDFVNQEAKSVDKIYHLMRRSSLIENNNLIAHTIVVIKDTIDALNDEISNEIREDLELTVWEETTKGNELLIEKYGLNSIYQSILANQ